MGILGELQAQVEDHNTEHQKIIEEKVEMIQRVSGIHRLSLSISLSLSLSLYLSIPTTPNYIS